MLAPATTQPPPTNTTTATTTTTSSSATNESISFLIILPLLLMAFWGLWNYSSAHDNFSFSNYSAATLYWDNHYYDYEWVLIIVSCRLKYYVSIFETSRLSNGIACFPIFQLRQPQSHLQLHQHRPALQPPHLMHQISVALGTWLLSLISSYLIVQKPNMSYPTPISFQIIFRNYASCGDGEWCNESKANCMGLCGGKLWMEPNPNCIPLYGECTDNGRGCCNPLRTVSCNGGKWYRQCQE